MFVKAIIIVASLLPTKLHDTTLHQGYQKPSRDDVRCLAVSIHQEARGEASRGRKAVADVIINRSLRSGESICKVIRKPFQLSFMNGRKSLPRVEKEFWKEAEQHLLALANGFHRDSTNGAMFFFRVDHHSELTRKLKLVKVVGSHKFMVSLQKLMKGK